MARLNVKGGRVVTAHTGSNVQTHEGAPAAYIDDFAALKRSVLSCFLWENEFYEDGQEIAGRIKALAEKCDPRAVAGLAVCARSVHNLRHVPLLLLEVLSRTGAGVPGLVSGAVQACIQRSDELSEFVALYMAGGRKPLSSGVKKGLAAAFQKFDEYQLAKYDREGAYRLRDVLFLCHAKPKDKAQQQLWSRLIEGELKVPDTWEVALSGGADKKETFTRLLEDGKLGYLALLRNLRNMEQAGVDSDVVMAAIKARKGAARVLPFRYVAAARAAPRYERALDGALLTCISEQPMLRGTTAVLVDVSGSMDTKLSGKSDLTRMDAAATLSSVLHCEDKIVATFSDRVVVVPPRYGMAGVDAVIKSQNHGGTYLGRAITELVGKYPKMDRLIVITDEQSHDPIPTFMKGDKLRRYLINVASARNGVGYGDDWVHIDGFSEGVIRFIGELEAGGIQSRDFPAIEPKPEQHVAAVERMLKPGPKAKPKAQAKSKAKSKAEKKAPARKAPAKKTVKAKRAR